MAPLRTHLRRIALAPIATALACGGAGNDTSGLGDDTSTATASASASASTDATSMPSTSAGSNDASSGVDPSSSVGTDADSSGGGGSDDTGLPPAESVTVHLVPQDGVSGVQRVNFAVPLWPGALVDGDAVTVSASGNALPSYRRVLASHRDGSVRSVQIQVELELAGETDVAVDFGVAGDVLEPVDVAQTLIDPQGRDGPRVWALLPATWLSDSGVTGPQLPADATVGAATAWAQLCDYDAWGIDTFEAAAADTGSWLYDRPTALYRGYARTGALSPLSSAYREAARYVADTTGSGASLQIPVPDASDDLKYHYAQLAAIHYLLTGDDRFREYAEDIATRAHDLWPDPDYAGGADFWTERHAGFALLAYVWAAIVSDDEAATFDGWADEAVDAYLAVQQDFPPGYDDPDARCFAHEAEAHGEDYGYVGCSPWMSAILADGIDAWIRERDGDAAASGKLALVQLGRIVARDGLDGEGRPFYWMGVGTDADEVDGYDEHWGESAYVVAMAWWHDGGRDAELRAAADALVAGFASHGEIGQLRSFNWQCRSAVATPWYLQ
ncbi:MAG: hypothetical protein K1X88_29330 [Nannocystaceae bacterium]|nr:hypothetical protein [Nannocystaceae bacterium]